MGRARRRLLLVLSLIAAVSSPGDAEAQGNRRTTLATTGFPISATSTTPVDYDAGFVAIGSTTFTVNLTTNAGGGGFSPRVTTVRVRCGSPCPASGTLPVSGLEWRRSDLGTWTPLTTAFADVEVRTATFNGTNDPWSNSLFWRYALTWAGVPPTAQTQYFIEFQLQVTAP
jgi:hypothetical protein